MIENEFKIMLDRERYEKLLSLYEWQEVIDQTNYYYDTKELALSALHITCRVREIAGKYYLQMKFPGASEFSREELEKPLDSLPDEIDADEPFRPHPHGHAMLPKVKRLGSLKTMRSVYRFNGGEIDLDKSEYFGKIDYELEIEFTDEDAARTVLAEIKAKLDLQTVSEVCTGKIRRFLTEYFISKTEVKPLKYGNTNTYFIKGSGKGLLVDTDWAGTLSEFFKTLKTAGYTVSDIDYVMVTHWHPDHIGLVGELAALGVKPLIFDVQREFIHSSDEILLKSGKNFTPLDEGGAKFITCAGSRAFLSGFGISGEVIHTPAHSADSVSLILDNGAAIVGDLPPIEVADGYDGGAVKESWSAVLSHSPKIIYYGHANEKKL